MAVNLDNLFLPGVTVGVKAAAAEASFGVFGVMPMVALSGKDLDLLGVHLVLDWGGSFSGLGEANEAGVAVLVADTAVVFVAIVVVVRGIGVDGSFSSLFLGLGSAGADDGASSFDDASSFRGGDDFSGMAVYSSTGSCCVTVIIATGAAPAITA